MQCIDLNSILLLLRMSIDLRLGFVKTEAKNWLIATKMANCSHSTLGVVAALKKHLAGLHKLNHVP